MIQPDHLPSRAHLVEGQRAGSHALVVGGSMAGLLAARVLSDHFDRVTIVERDRFPSAPEYRAGVPQSRHLHVLLGRGLLLLEQHFPGIDAALLDRGAMVLEWPWDMLWLTSAGWSRRFHTGSTIVCASRELLEWCVRDRVSAIGNVRFLEEHDAIGLLATDEKTRVTGVQLRHRGAPDAEPASTGALAADLVVDASGRHSRAPQWLEELGYDPPAETVVNSFLGYASRYYVRSAAADRDWKAMLLLSKPPSHMRGGGLFPIEGDRWIATLTGMGRDYPPTDEDGFLSFARSLRSPVLYEAIRDAEPLSPIRGYQRTENRLRHFERLERWPERFVVLGDAACAFNPVYGQGMTIAAQGATVLDDCLREQRSKHSGGDLVGLSRRFQQQLARTNAVAWLLATGEDRRYPTTEGGRTNPLTRLTQRYINRVTLVATQDPVVNRAFFSVVNLLAPPTTLFHPRIVARVIAAGHVRGLAQPPTTALVAAPRLGRA